jgi:hypothetical protein
MNFLVFLVFFVIGATSADFNASSSDAQLEQINADLIAEESSLENMMLDLASFIDLTNADLKSQNKTTAISNLCGSLSNLAKMLTQLATLDNHWPYDHVNTCTDINRKLTSIDFDSRHYTQLVGQVWANLTQLQSQHNWVNYYYAIAFTPLVTSQESQQRMLTILESARGITAELVNYIQLLNKDIANVTAIGSKLRLYKRNFCSCTTSMPKTVAANASTLESNVRYVEEPLVALQSAVLAAASDALVKVKAADAVLVGSAAPIAITRVDQTEAFLTNLVTIADHSGVVWSNSSACSDLIPRVAFLLFKYRQYVNVHWSSSVNTSWANAHLANLNFSVKVYKLNDKQTVAMKALIGSMMTLTPLMKNYTTHLGYSVNRMWNMYVDMKYFGDTWCSCQAGVSTAAGASTTSGTKLASTSTSAKITTTTTTSETFFS